MIILHLNKVPTTHSQPNFSDFKLLSYLKVISKNFTRDLDFSPNIAVTRTNLRWNSKIVCLCMLTSILVSLII